MMKLKQTDEPCMECEELTNGWIAATEQLSRSVDELTGKMGTVPKHQYDAMYDAAEQARRMADAAETALRHHRSVHHSKRGLAIRLGSD